MCNRLGKTGGGRQRRPIGDGAESTVQSIDSQSDPHHLCRKQPPPRGAAAPRHSEAKRIGRWIHRVQIGTQRTPMQCNETHTAVVSRGPGRPGGYARRLHVTYRVAYYERPAPARRARRRRPSNASMKAGREGKKGTGKKSEEAAGRIGIRGVGRGTWWWWIWGGAGPAWLARL
jgi:hypothetical protein